MPLAGLSDAPIALRWSRICAHCLPILSANWLKWIARAPGSLMPSLPWAGGPLNDRQIDSLVDFSLE